MQRTLSPEEKLRFIGQLFRQDSRTRGENREIAERQGAALPSLQAAIAACLAQEINLDGFRHNIHATLNQAPEWGLSGTWMMNFHQLANYSTKYPERGVEQRLRAILDGLNAGNLGHRIEAFHDFLIEEKEQAKPVKGEWPASGSSAFFLSVFAARLDPNGHGVIAWPSSTTALRFLRDIGALPTSPMLSNTKHHSGPPDLVLGQAEPVRTAELL